MGMQVRLAPTGGGGVGRWWFVWDGGEREILFFLMRWGGDGGGGEGWVGGEVRWVCFGVGACFVGGGTERKVARDWSWDDGKFEIELELG